MNTGSRFLVALAAIVILTAGGTAGYIAIEHMRFLDALYMTVITISTVGYEEVKPLGEHGRIFTMVLIVTALAPPFMCLPPSPSLWSRASCASSSGGLR